MINKKQTPRASIIMAVYNCERYIEVALKSVANQTLGDYECIVTNDGSTDNTAVILADLAKKDPRLKVITIQNSGVATAMNNSLDIACGEMIMRLDGDDLIPPDRLAWQYDFLTNNLAFGAVCGQMSACKPNGNHISHIDCYGSQSREITDLLRDGIAMTHFNTFGVRTHLLKNLGGFRPYFRQASELDVELRLSDTCRIWYEPKDSYQYRLHSESIVHKTPSANIDFFGAQTRLFQKQRKKNGVDDLELGLGVESAPSINDTQTKCYKPANLEIAFLSSQLWKEYKSRKLNRAFQTSLRLCLMHPFAFCSWRHLLVLSLCCLRKR